MTALANESRYNTTRQDHIADVLNQVAWAFWGPVLDADENISIESSRKTVAELEAITTKAAADIEAVLSKVAA
jgi:hypothetical protein